MSADAGERSSGPEGQGLIWDACALLNLLATGRAGEIAVAMGRPCLVVARVRVHEAYYLRPLPEEDPQRRLIPADSSPRLQAGLLRDVELDEAERQTFAEFARVLDDGEARTAAVAVHRGLRVATDDGLTLRFLRARADPVTVWTTPEWVRHWAERSGASSGVIADVLRRIEVCARYRPGRSHPLREWWESHLGPQ